MNIKVQNAKMRSQAANPSKLNTNSNLPAIQFNNNQSFQLLNNNNYEQTDLLRNKQVCVICSYDVLMFISSSCSD